MNATLEGAMFICMWIGFLLLMIGCIVAIFVWAVRNRQFADQERARYLPLVSGIPPGDPLEKDADGRGGAKR